MKKIVLLAMCASLYAAPSGLYIELNGAQGFDTKMKTDTAEYNYDRGNIGSAALGYQIDTFRIELEGEYQSNKISSYGMNNNSASGDFIRESQMFNVYYSGYNESKLVSSIGIGAGSSDFKINSFSSSGSTPTDTKFENVFTYQASFSIGYMVNKHLTFQTKYKYIVTAKQEGLKESGGSMLGLGIRILF